MRRLAPLAFLLNRDRELFFEPGIHNMAVSEEYLQYVMGQLSEIGPISSRKMFGGVGLYLYGLFLGLIDDDVLYFKVDDSNREDYLTAGMEPFRPFGPSGYAMQFYEVPIEVLEDVEAVKIWAMKSAEVARRKKQRPR